jgi:hypothetical protein
MRGARVAAAIAFCGIAVGGVLLLALGALAPGRLALSDDGPATCPWLMLTHFRCPLCGMTRATFHLLRGDLRGALHLHPLGPLVLAVAVGGAMIWLGTVALGRPLPAWFPTRARTWIAFGVVVWTVNLAFGHG